jgi:rod shape determining protein RodA
MDRSERLGLEQVRSIWARPTRPAWHYLDVTLLLAAVALSVIGVLAVYAATSHRLVDAGLPASAHAARHGALAAAGAGVALLIMSIDYLRWRALTGVAWLLSLGLLAAVWAPLGQAARGAERWVDLGILTVQPAEFVKLAVIVAGAAWLARREDGPRIRDVLVVVLVTAIPVVLVAAQPDLGTAAVLAWLGAILLVVGRAQVRWLVGLGISAMVGLMVALESQLLRDYQVERITAFLRPDDPELYRTALYNTRQALIAMGVGGVHGQGFGQGMHTRLAYVPESSTDFILTVIGEEAGFVGTTVVLGLFAVLVLRAIWAAATAADLFGTLLCAGVAGLWFIHMAINVGMTLGLLPVVGLPLPFVSFGGSALLAAWIGVGIVESVRMRRHRLTARQPARA